MIDFHSIKLREDYHLWPHPGSWRWRWHDPAEASCESDLEPCDAKLPHIDMGPLSVWNIKALWFWRWVAALIAPLRWLYHRKLARDIGMDVLSCENFRKQYCEHFYNHD